MKLERIMPYRFVEISKNVCQAVFPLLSYCVVIGYSVLFSEKLGFETDDSLIFVKSFQPS